MIDLAENGVLDTELHELSQRIHQLLVAEQFVQASTLLEERQQLLNKIVDTANRTDCPSSFVNLAHSLINKMIADDQPYERIIKDKLVKIDFARYDVSQRRQAVAKYSDVMSKRR